MGWFWQWGVGKNVGIEINGKSEKFSHPVIIYKKLSAFGFLGIPMSTQQHTGSWYVPFDFWGKRSVAVLSQVRTISTMRLYRRMGELDEIDFKKVRDGFRAIYF